MKDANKNIESIIFANLDLAVVNLNRAIVSLDGIPVLLAGEILDEAHLTDVYQDIEIARDSVMDLINEVEGKT